MRAGYTSRARWRRRGRPRYAGALTPRQQDVCELLVTGLTNEEIAQHLGITPYGVKYHAAEILQRLGVENRYEAASLHLRTEGSGRFAAWAPVMFLRKLPFAWLPKAAAGAVLTATAAGIALFAWSVLPISIDAVTTTGCSGEQSVDNPPSCASGVAQAGTGAEPISAISAAGSKSCALEDGGVWCWGWSGDGIEGSSVPVAVPGLATGVSAISAGAYHTCALKDGGVWCWSSPLGGTPGAISVSPVAVPVLASGVSSISTGNLHTCALKDGGVWCWDWILGGTPRARVDSVPVTVPSLASGVSAISDGWGLSCALKDGGAGAGAATGPASSATMARRTAPRRWRCRDSGAVSARSARAGRTSAP